MITDIESARMVVISDMHLGNPFSRAKKKTIHFLQWAGRNGYDICINGDGFEIAQVSFQKLARDVPDVLHALKAATKAGSRVYYVVGNHDIVFEYFLNDWGGFKVAPFLNVWSGESRIRIEHGHLYDPFFVRHPELYEFCTWFAGFLLKISPSVYRLWISFEKLRSRFWVHSRKSITGEHPNFAEAAYELSERGFDYVIFGHTHHAGMVEFARGKKYFNSGSWMLGAQYLLLEEGQLSLCDFDLIFPNKIS